jgi:hypothetical protein
MLRYVVSGAAALIVSLAAATAFGQGGEGGIDNGSMLPPVITDFKTPPMRDSDVIQLPLAIHPAQNKPNWAGYRLSVHVLDASEVDVVGVTLADGTYYPEPFGAWSQNTQSVVKFFTFWAPNAMASGTQVVGSQNIPAGWITLHAKNTDPINNSDVDLALDFANIRHLMPAQATDTLVLKASWSIWALSQWEPTFLPELPYPVTPGNPDASWKHIPFTTTIHFTQSVPGSNFILSALNTAWVGIEHVPEPASVVLLIFGGAAVGMSLISRWRRKR